MADMNVDREVALLVEELQRFGGRVKFGTLCTDERCANVFEALGGTLRAAKKRKVITYDSELLLQGAHDDVDIVLLQPSSGKATPASQTPASQEPASSKQPTLESDQPAAEAEPKPQTEATESASEQQPSKQPQPSEQPTLESETAKEASSEAKKEDATSS